MKFTGAPEDPKHTFHTMFIGPENSFASIFWRSLAFSVSKYFANKGLQKFGEKMSNMRNFWKFTKFTSDAIPVQFMLKWRHPICSTSHSGGNQVDGLPAVVVSSLKWMLDWKFKFDCKPAFAGFKKNYETGAKRSPPFPMFRGPEGQNPKIFNFQWFGDFDIKIDQDFGRHYQAVQLKNQFMCMKMH